MKLTSRVFLSGASVVVMLWLVSPATSLSPAQSSAQKIYDRQGLVDLMKSYLAALVAHNPNMVPFDKEVKFTENTANISVGEGLWTAASGGPTEFQIYAADPVTQQVACLVMMKETKYGDSLVAIRLALRRGKISEAEHYVRQGLAHALPNLQKPRPGLVEDVAPGDRTPREQMRDIGLSYYDALIGGDGTLAPFAKECERHDDGETSVGGDRQAAGRFPASDEVTLSDLGRAVLAAPNTCAGQISAGVWGYMSAIKNRRLVVIDEQKGLAVGCSVLNHDAKLKTMKLKGVPGLESVPSVQLLFNMPSMHFFKIKKGKIYEIEDIGVSVPYGTKSGWE